MSPMIFVALLAVVDKCKSSFNQCRASSIFNILKSAQRIGDIGFGGQANEAVHESSAIVPSPMGCHQTDSSEVDVCLLC